MIPPPNTTQHRMQRYWPAWSFLRSRRNMVAAIALSAAVHLFAYVSMPLLVAAWHEPPAAIYSAVLVSQAVEKMDEPRSRAPQTANRARGLAAPTRPRPRAAPRTDANFVAPENSIATEPAAELPEIAPAVVTEAGQTEPTAKVETPASDLPPPPTAEVVEAGDKVANVELPRQIAIAYRMTSSISDGVADYAWTREGNQYEIDSTMQATGFIVGSLVGALHQVSRGELTAAGLEPLSFRIRRGEGEPETAEFIRASKEMKLMRGGQTRTLPMPAQIQDMQSFLFQLAFDAPRLKSADDRLDVLVTNARKVYRHRFKQLGLETIQTRFGAIETVHLLSEATDPEDAYEVWLAPKNYHLPVKIKFFAGRFPIELIATSIRSTP